MKLNFVSKLIGRGNRGGGQFVDFKQARMYVCPHVVS